MAKISFDIGSTFSGEGFNKANTAVSNLAGTAGKTIAPIRQIGTALGNLPGPAGQAAQAVTGVIGAVKSFGLVGAIVAGAQAGINLAINKMKKDLDSMRESAEKAATSMQKSLDKLVKETFGGMGTALDRVKAKASDNVKSLENMTKAAEKIESAYQRLAGKEADATIVQLELDKLAKLAEVETKSVAKFNDTVNALDAHYKEKKATSETELESQKKLIEAEFALKIAIQERQNAVEASAKEIDAAKTAEKNASDRVVVSRQNYDDALVALKEANEKAKKAEAIRFSHVEQYNEVIKQQKLAAEHAKKMEDDLTKAKADLEAAQIDVKTSELAAKNAENKRTAKVQESEKALEDLKSAQAQAAIAEDKCKTLKEEIADAEKKRDSQKEDLARKEKVWQEEQEQVVGELNQARTFAAQWEHDKAALEEKGFKDLNELQRNGYEQYLYVLKDGRKQYLKDMSDEEKKNLKDIMSVSEKQIPASARERVQAYKDWLEHQSPNPYNIDIQRLTDKLETFPEQSKIDLQQTREGIEKSTDAIKDLKQALVDAVKVN